MNNYSFQRSKLQNFDNVNLNLFGVSLSLFGLDERVIKDIISLDLFINMNSKGNMLFIGRAIIIEYKGKFNIPYMNQKINLRYELFQFGIKKQHRRKGYGKILLDEVKKQIPEPVYILAHGQAKGFYLNQDAKFLTYEGAFENLNESDHMVLNITRKKGEELTQEIESHLTKNQIQELWNWNFKEHLLQIK